MLISNEVYYEGLCVEDGCYSSDFVISGHIFCEVKGLINEETFLSSIVTDINDILLYQ